MEKQIRGVIIGLTLTTIFASSAYAVLANQQTDVQVKSESKVITTSPEEEKQTTIEIPTVQIENEITTKQEAVYRMINAIDYYHSIEIHFSATKKAGELIESIHLSAINLSNNHLTKIDTTYSANNRSTLFYDNGNIETENFDSNDKSLGIDTSFVMLEGASSNHSMTLADSIKIGEDGEKLYKARPDANYYSNAKIVALPSDLAINLLEDESIYELTGTEKKAGRNTVVLEGSLSDANQVRYQSDHFKLNIDAKTGVLLGMSFTNNGIEKDYLNVSSVTFDQLPEVFKSN
ncbi:hypothetical protein [Enterococcus sp. 1001283B150225_161107_E12]|uniref:hypothetical protein n=1 Tax=Enterococcus sp. 1001283B150225_161107_E12 TaxID=2787145 RepID=UPI00189C807C|nr:hypothetical protein [Enterococcus sp. 1001283B150225_161107_E12]